MPGDSAEEEIRLLRRDDPLDASLDSDDDEPISLATKRRRQKSSLRRSLAFVIPCHSARPSKVLAIFQLLVLAIISIIIAVYAFFPSYSRRPQHYRMLEERISSSSDTGRGNPRHERVFIAAALYDKNGHLTGGRWGEQLLELVDLLGPENAFVSIYENDNGPKGAAALQALQQRLPCANDVVYEQVDKRAFPRVTMPDGEEQVKRILYLSEMRNRSLRPLDQHGNVTYDRVLILNDVYFDPADALHLLFSTNIGSDGRADYLAACGLDFSHYSWKLYDTFATRDLDGYSMGVPIYPFFSSAGSAASRADVLAQRDAVRIKSCWSGMAAFTAQYLQSPSADLPPGYGQIGAANIDPESPHPVAVPARFRAEPEIFFDACECCLLMADVLQLGRGTTNFAADADSGIYMNPFVRVAYEEETLWKLAYSRRFERLFSPVQWLATRFVGLPTFNPYRDVLEGQQFQEEVWLSAPETENGGRWETRDRTARNGLYCSVREMQVILNETRHEDRNWENSAIPAGGTLF